MLHLAADLTNVAHNITGMGNSALGSITVLAGGASALAAKLARKHGLMFGALITTIFVGWFFFDPTSVTNIVKGTAHALGK